MITKLQLATIVNNAGERVFGMQWFDTFDNKWYYTAVYDDHRVLHYETTQFIEPPFGVKTSNRAGNKWELIPSTCPLRWSICAECGSNIFAIDYLCPECRQDDKIILS